MLLLLIGIVLSLESIKTEYISLYNFGYGNVATPPQNWQYYYWAVLSGGLPNASVFFDNKTVELTEVSNFTLPHTTHFVYIISGYVQPYAFLSPLSFFMILSGTLIGFKGTTLFFQGRILGKDLIKGYAVGGSIRKYVLKRLTSAIISLGIVSAIVILLEYFHGANVIKATTSLLELNPGISEHFDVSVNTLILTSLAYTSLLLGISFSLTIYLSAFLVVYSLENKRLLSIINKWKYIGSALASWVFSIIIIYLLHFFTNLLPYGTPKGGNILPYLIMPILSLFFPYIGIFANKVLSSIPKPDFSYKGLNEKVIIYRHVLGNITVLMLSIMSSAFVEMLVAELLVEGIFLWPGFGELLKIGVFYGDYKIVETSMLTYSTIAVLSNFFADVTYGFLDPRVTR